LPEIEAEISLGNGYKLVMRFDTLDGEDNDYAELRDPDGELISQNFLPEHSWFPKYGRSRVKKWLDKELRAYSEVREVPELEGHEWQERRNRIREAYETVQEAEAKKEEEKPQHEQWEEAELEEKADRLLTNPRLILEVDEAIHDFMIGEHRNAMVDFIACLSTLTDEPINLRWSGRSSTGKSAIAVASSKCSLGNGAWST